MFSRTFKITLLVLALVAGSLCSLAILRSKDGDGEGLTAPQALVYLAVAESKFRAHDRDGDGKKQFWRADVAGLYALAPGKGPAIRLIPLPLAAADDRPLPHLERHAVRSAAWGYWYRAIRHVDEGAKPPDPNRFAFCAYPDSPSAGKYIYICDEKYVIYRSAANGRRGIEVFPTEEELKAQWQKLD